MEKVEKKEILKKFKNIVKRLLKTTKHYKT